MTYVIVRMPDRDDMDTGYDPEVIGPFATRGEAEAAINELKSDYPYTFSYTSGLGFTHEMTHRGPDYDICELTSVGAIRLLLHETRKALRS